MPSSGKRPAIKLRPTLRDVARIAGLSQATVSLALNRSAETCPLTPATRQRAIAAAEQLGYRPNFRARALAKGRSSTVGLVFAREAPLMTGVNEQIVEALTDTLHTHGYYQLLVPLIGQPDDWRDVIRPDRIDGCIVLYPLPVQLSEILAETRLPMVAINLESELPIPHVLPDDAGGMRLLMDHLLSLGHRDIAYFYSAANVHFSVERRSQAYIAAMQTAGLGGRVRIYAKASAEMCFAAYQRAERKPTAIIAYDHVLAVALLHECIKHGVRVPEDLSIATFNDVFPVSLTSPALTVVALPGGAMGRTAAELLKQMIDSQTSATTGTATAQSVQLPAHLIVRASTAPPAR